jgi:NAD(P)H dehydrogenase (quinone)
MTIGITGATGQLGRLITAKLKAKIGADGVVALVRSPDKAGDLGVATRRFDYAQADLLAPALKGIDTLMFVSSSEIGQRAAQHHNVIEAAKAAGVKRIVYTSLLHADVSPLSLAPEHRLTEQELATSGIPHTILRNGWYTENHTGGVAAALANGAVAGSAGEGRFSAAARADFADAAVAVLTGAGHDRRTYELAGDDAYTLAGYAAELSRQTGRALPYVDLPAGEYAGALAQAGVPEGFAAMIAGWDVDAAKGALFDGGRTLSKLIGRPTTPLAAVIKDTFA